MVTAESKTENVIAAKKAGVNNYIVKPFNAADAQNKIDAVFADDVSRCQRTAGTQPSYQRMLAHHGDFGCLTGGHDADRFRRKRCSVCGSARSPSSSAWMPAVTNRQSIPQRGGALQIGAHRIADRQHAVDAAPRRRAGLRRAPAPVVDRPVRLAGIEHLAAHRL